SAVVLAGASLTQALNACGGESEQPPASDDASTTANTASDRNDAGASDARFTPAEAGTPADPVDAGSCPDGSDQPTPPCVLIK
ncbi:MAG: hypothetical protein K0S65_6665, partial [Labilithrix sp.]|nr:hypothetical protein [Labilithrix sp.]